jgi:phosphotransferase system HPr-like phosphotransfer protein
MEARKFHVHDKVTRNLHARRAAVGTRIVTGFECSVRVKHNRVGMAHDIRVSLGPHRKRERKTAI